MKNRSELIQVYDMMDECILLDKTISSAVATANQNGKNHIIISAMNNKKTLKCTTKKLETDTPLNIGRNDIISGPGCKYDKHPGNIKYKTFLCKNIVYFVNAKSHLGRSAVAKHVLNQLVDVMGARFIKYCPASKRW